MATKKDVLELLDQTKRELHKMACADCRAWAAMERREH